METILPLGLATSFLLLIGINKIQEWRLQHAPKDYARFFVDALGELRFQPELWTFRSAPEAQGHFNWLSKGEITFEYYSFTDTTHVTYPLETGGRCCALLTKKDAQLLWRAYDEGQELSRLGV